MFKPSLGIINFAVYVSVKNVEEEKEAVQMLFSLLVSATLWVATIHFEISEPHESVLHCCILIEVYDVGYS